MDALSCYNQQLVNLYGKRKRTQEMQKNTINNNHYKNYV